MDIYFDSSALAKRYIFETGSSTIIQWCTKADEIITSIITPSEIISAFNRLLRENQFSKHVYQDLKHNLSRDIENCKIIPFNPDVLNKTIDCIENAKIKTLDAIQVASALLSDCDLFISADKKQCQVASTLGLDVRCI